MPGRSNPSSPEAPNRLPRELVLFGRSLGRGVLAGIALVVLTLFGATTASAYWKASGTGSTTASVATLAPPTGVSVPATSNSNVSLSWTASASTPVPTGYYVTRITGTTSTPACGSSPAAPIAGTACTDSSVPQGTHRYVVTAVHRSWTAAGAASGSVSVDNWLGIVFTVQPATVTAGSSIPVQVALRIGQWAWPAANVPVTISIGSNPGGGTLSGTATAYTNGSGVATFSGLSINKAGAGYTLVASSPGYSGAVSTGFTVTAAAASKLVITDPASITGAASATAGIGPVTVERQDAYGNPVTTGSSALTLTSNSAGTHKFAATAGGPAVTTVTIPAGSASASFYYGDQKAGSLNITASRAGLTPASKPVTVTAAAPSKLAFGVQLAPIKNQTITPAVTVSIQDTYGNLTAGTAQVTVESPCNLHGTLSAAASGGVASFADLKFNGNGSGCTLIATSPQLQPATSNTFNLG